MGDGQHQGMSGQRRPSNWECSLNSCLSPHISSCSGKPSYSIPSPDEMSGREFILYSQQAGMNRI